MQKWWWPPWMASQDHGIHSFKECVPEGSDYFQKTPWRRRSSNHKKRREDGSNWRSSYFHPKKIPQAMRNMKNSTLEELLIHLSFWIRNNAIMNEEDDEAEGSRRSLPLKQIKISIQLSFHDIVLLCICYIQLMYYAWKDVCINGSILLICMWWVSSSWCYTTLDLYLSRMKPLCWHIGLVHNLNVVLVEMEGI